MVDAPRALVVNDCRDMAVMMGKRLDAAGSAVHEIAGTYKEALESFEKGRHAIAVIDTNLPGRKYGPDLADALRGIDPRVYIVGVSVDKDYAELWEGRADDFQEAVLFNPVKIFSGYEAKKRKNKGLSRRKKPRLA